MIADVKLPQQVFHLGHGGRLSYTPETVSNLQKKKAKKRRKKLKSTEREMGRVYGGTI